MLRYIILCYVALRYTLYYIALYDITLHYIIVYNIILCLIQNIFQDVKHIVNHILMRLLD
jgi:hypothetical protein